MRKKLLLIILMCLTFSMSGCICSSKEVQKSSELEVGLNDNLEEDPESEKKPTVTPTPSEAVVPTTTPMPTPSEPVVPTATPTPTPSEPVVPMPPPSEPVVPTVTPTPTPSEPVVPTVTPTPTPSEPVVPTVTPTPTPVPGPRLPGIVEAGTPVDAAGILTYVPNEIIEENASQQILAFQDNLLYVNAYYNFETGTSRTVFSILSMDTGEVLLTTEISASGANIQVVGDKIVVAEADSGRIRVYNSSLEMTQEYYVTTGSFIYVNTALTKAYSFSWSNGLSMTELATGNEKNLLGNVTRLLVSAVNGNSISMSYADLSTGMQNYAGLNLETDEIEMLDLETSFNGIEYYAGNWMGQFTTDEDKYLLGTQNEPYKFVSPYSSALISLLGAPSRLLITESTNDGGRILSLYDMDGTFISALSLDPSMVSYDFQPIWLEAANGYLFTVMNEEYKDELYFWDLSVEVSGENLELIPFDQEEDLGGEALPQEYYDRAATLSEQYDVTIKIGDQCETDYGTKTAESMLDTEVVDIGLNVLEAAFGCFPDNFFSQLYYDNVYEMEINLVGDIEYKEVIEGHDPAGFVLTTSGKNIMVLDLNYDEETLRSIIFHETAHIIDKKLVYDAKYRENALYSEDTWLTFNPEGFEYAEAYGGSLTENWLKYETYFIDEYSTTFAAEDRARIFEYAMMQKSVYFHPTGAPARLAKLEYFSACIRDAFDTTSWPAETTWEYTMNHAGESSGGGKG